MNISTGGLAAEGPASKILDPEDYPGVAVAFKDAVSDRNVEAVVKLFVPAAPFKGTLDSEPSFDEDGKRTYFTRLFENKEGLAVAFKKVWSAESGKYFATVTFTWDAPDEASSPKKTMDTVFRFEVDQDGRISDFISAMSPVPA